jgi:hypothetical protein
MRFAGVTLLAVIVLSAMLGYAASFEIDPIVSQELVVNVEDVETSTSGGPSPSQEETQPNFAFVVPSNSTDGAAGCGEAGTAGVDDCDRAAVPEVRIDPTATPTATPTPTPRSDGVATPTYAAPVFIAY